MCFNGVWDQQEFKWMVSPHIHVLLQIICCRYFHVCNGGLLPDIMHDVLEGALQFEVKLMLKEMIKVDKIFSLCTNLQIATTSF